MGSKTGTREQMNQWGESGTPFLFIIDFEQYNPLIFRLDTVDPENLLYNINGISNLSDSTKPQVKPALIKYPLSFDDYLLKFNIVKKEIDSGNSYLLNLTCSTDIDINLSLKEVFCVSNSKYRIWLDEQFVCFSPETFVTISEGVIRSYPMKGTIDANIPEARKMILEDPKEKAEHFTIVDLIRNDLSMVSENVRVERFRYFDVIQTNDKQLLQVSSEVCGDLHENSLSHIGDIIFKLLPAGSVSGAPKRKTTEIIAEVEGNNRGFYTGVFGLFDGKNLDSAVMIRYIEKKNCKYYYRSGGGITAFSDPLSEYEEMIDKIYVPAV